MRELSLSIFIIMMFNACAVNYQNINLNKIDSFDENISLLSKEIQNLSKEIDKEEAKRVAYNAITYSKYLANKYQIVKPALFHNTLIHLNLREKGYCYHYANDLKKYLEKKGFKSFYFIKTVANRGEYFEHSSIILTRDDIDFENSLVLDAWRDSGILFFSKVKDDTRYKWQIK